MKPGVYISHENQVTVYMCADEKAVILSCAVGAFVGEEYVYDPILTSLKPYTGEIPKNADGYPKLVQWTRKKNTPRKAESTCEGQILLFVKESTGICIKKASTPEDLHVLTDGWVSCDMGEEEASYGQFHWKEIDHV